MYAEVPDPEKGVTVTAAFGIAYHAYGVPARLVSGAMHCALMQDTHVFGFCVRHAFPVDGMHPSVACVQPPFPKPPVADAPHSHPLTALQYIVSAENLTGTPTLPTVCEKLTVYVPAPPVPVRMAVMTVFEVTPAPVTVMPTANAPKI